MPDADYNLITAYPTVDIIRPAVIAYNGLVIDNAHVSIRGESTQNAPKVSWKIEMPQEPRRSTFPGTVDAGRRVRHAGRLDRQLARPSAAGLGLLRDGRRRQRRRCSRSGRSATRRSKVSTPTWTSSTAPGATARATRPAVLQGRSRRLRRHQAAASSTGSRRRTPRTTTSPRSPLPDGRRPDRAAAQRDYLLATRGHPRDDQLRGRRPPLVQHVDSISKNFYLSQDPATGRWEIIPWDLDHTLGNGCCGVTSPFVTPAEPGDRTSELMQALLAVPEWRQMYFRRLRTVVNQVLATGRPEALYDAKVGPAQPESTLDFAKWPRSVQRHLRESCAPAVHGHPVPAQRLRQRLTAARQPARVARTS